MVTGKRAVAAGIMMLLSPFVLVIVAGAATGILILYAIDRLGALFVWAGDTLYGAEK